MGLAIFLVSSNLWWQSKSWNASFWSMKGWCIQCAHDLGPMFVVVSEQIRIFNLSSYLNLHSLLIHILNDPKILQAGRHATPSCGGATPQSLYRQRDSVTQVTMNPTSWCWVMLVWYFSETTYIPHPGCHRHHPDYEPSLLGNHNLKRFLSDWNPGDFPRKWIHGSPETMEVFLGIPSFLKEIPSCFANQQLGIHSVNWSIESPGWGK